MNTMHLRYALEVEKTGSISKAADALFISQPNLSKAIRELETSIGVQIFNRTSKGVAPTEQGRRLLQYARNVLAQVEKIEALRWHTGEQHLSYRVAFPLNEALENIVAEFTTKIIKAYQEVGLQLKFKQVNAVSAIQGLADNCYDLAVVRYQSEHEAYFQRYLQENGLRGQLLQEFPCRLLLSRDHALAKSEQIHMSDLSGCIELMSSDNLVPYLPTQPENSVAGSRVLIHADGRSVQMALLRCLPTAYMWTGPFPAAMLKQENMVQRLVTGVQPLIRDVLIRHQERDFQDIDKMLISIIQHEYQAAFLTD